MSFSHHDEVAPLKPNQQEHWLEIAERDKLSVYTLRKEIGRATAEPFTGFTGEQDFEEYFRELMHAAEIPKPFTYILPPWKRTDVAEYLAERLERIDFSRQFEPAVRFDLERQDYETLITAIETAAVLDAHGAMRARLNGRAPKEPYVSAFQKGDTHNA